MSRFVKSGVLKAIAYGICVPVFLLLSFLYFVDKVGPALDGTTTEDKTFLVEVRKQYPDFTKSPDKDLVSAGQDICTQLEVHGAESLYTLAGVASLDTQALNALITASVKVYCPSPWTDLLDEDK